MSQKTLTNTSPKKMANKQMKRCSTSYAIKEMKIRTLKHLLEWLEWPESKTPITPNADEDMEQQDLSFIAGGNANWYSYSGRQFGSFLQN